MFKFPSVWHSISLLLSLINSLLHDGVNSYFSLLKLPTKTAAIIWKEDPRLKKKRKGNNLISWIPPTSSPTKNKHMKV